MTTGEKFVRIYRGWDSIGQVCMVFRAAPGQGEFTPTLSIDQATLLAQGEWLAAGVDDAAPRLTRAVYLTLNESGTYTYNITSGEGSGGGEPAEITARVRVEGALAERELVFIEKPSNGQYRIAGYGPAEGGEDVIELKVTDGVVYALAMDDWGTLFQPSLNVTEGQVIRPSLMLGWLYRITQTGQLPATEPAWWDDSLAGPQPLGTARAEVIRYYRPQAAGPQAVETT
ncbi:hypothetical protein [Pseudomonas citronellolis]|uniref:hypothetical protein n=1 Tax=Pseudomonas citronellolis TaxID=53408 RepID=UPI0023E3E7E2|nr:hypothetical protein [Pseudomonas citronellolis]MDF3935463.1 hypothetical protein [Pseudomonas citronellolis]